MRKAFANLICSFIPHKPSRRQAREVMTAGLWKALVLKLRFIREQRREPRFEQFLSVAAIAKNEGRYIKEWLEFHLMVGVEKFYIYDNDSSDDTREVLAPYIERGLVEYIFFPGQAKQLPAYRDVIGRASERSKWLAFIDLDEFIVPIETRTVPEFLRKLPRDVSQLLIGWMLYGSSGHKTRPEGLLIENYKWRVQDGFVADSKCIVNPRTCLHVSFTHWWTVVGKSVDENGDRLSSYPFPTDEGTRAMPKRRIRINHYYSKSLQEFQERLALGSAVDGAHVISRRKDLFELFDRNNVPDPLMDPYIPVLRRRVAGNGTPVACARFPGAEAALAGLKRAIR